MPTRDVTVLSSFTVQASGSYCIAVGIWLTIIVQIAMATHNFSTLTLFAVGFVLTIDVSFRDRRFFIQGRIRRLTENSHPCRDL